MKNIDKVANEIINATNEGIEAVKQEVMDKLKGSGIEFKEVSVSSQKEITVIMNQIALGKNWEEVEEKFYSLFPDGEYKKIDIYL